MAKKRLLAAKKFRNADSFKRQELNRNSETILIVCEGEKTEVNYFNAIKKEHRIASLTVKPAETGSAPINVVQYAIDLTESIGGFDRVYCVFDRDEHSTYAEALQLLNDYKPSEKVKREGVPIFQAITSVPCFEIWPLLHFKYTAKPYNPKGNASPGDQVQKELRQYLPEYSKQSSEWFPKLHARVDVALTNSARLKKENSKTDSQNPATDLHDLVSHLMKIGT